MRSADMAASVSWPTEMPLSTSQAIELIESASGPADLFGADLLGPGAARRYRRLARLTHPDVTRADARSAAAFAKLAALWQRHCVISGTEADGRPVGPVVARGDLANLYQLRPRPAAGQSGPSQRRRWPR